MKTLNGEEWQTDSHRWNDWAFHSYAEAVHTTAALNEGTDYGTSGVPIDIPIFVMNIFHRQDRRQSITMHLTALGFTNFSFPQTVSWTDLNISELVADGMVNWNAFRQAHSPTHCAFLLSFSALPSRLFTFPPLPTALPSSPPPPSSKRRPAVAPRAARLAVQRA